MLNPEMQTLAAGSPIPSGAIIIGAEVSVSNIATNVSVNTQTNSEGHFSLTGLIPGEYSVTVASPGFRTSERDGITLRVGDRLALEIPSKSAAQQNGSRSPAEAPLIRTEDAQAGPCHRQQAYPGLAAV